jgi:hypothetical protein
VDNGTAGGRVLAMVGGRARYTYLAWLIRLVLLNLNLWIDRLACMRKIEEKNFYL